MSNFIINMLLVCLIVYWLCYYYYCYLCGYFHYQHAACVATFIIKLTGFVATFTISLTGSVVTYTGVLLKCMVVSNLTINMLVLWLLSLSYFCGCFHCQHAACVATFIIKLGDCMATLLSNLLVMWLLSLSNLLVMWLLSLSNLLNLLVL